MYVIYFSGANKKTLSLRACVAISWKRNDKQLRPISFYKCTALQGVSVLDFNATFPFPQVFSLSPFPLAREPTVTAWRGTTLGRDITNAISLIMPLRLRGSYATKRHAFSYFTSSPTLDLLAAVAARVPSLKLHSPFISTLRISFRIRLRLPQLLIIHY